MENKYIVYNAYVGYGEKPQEFTSLKKMNEYLNDEIRKGKILTVRVEKNG